MYTHSMAYSFDNYTNTGLQATYAVTKNLFLQFGVTVGSDTMPWNVGRRVLNPVPECDVSGCDDPQGSGRDPVLHGVRALPDR